MLPQSYLDHLTTIPLPSVEQTVQFARGVRTAHSWYKKLPPKNPGMVFTFLLDPFRGTKYSGRSREDDDDMLHQIGHWCFYSRYTENELIEMNGIVVPQDIVQTCSQRFTACLFDDGDGYYSRSWRGVLQRRMRVELNDEELNILLDEAGGELNDVLQVASMLLEPYCLNSTSLKV